jgi:hypothetical protein
MAIIIGAGSGNAISVNSTVGTVGQVITSDGTNASWDTKGVTNVTLQTFVAPGTWTKPSTVVAIKVTVVGGGGAGAFPGSGGGGGGTAIETILAPAIPGPVAVTAGAGTNSFGAFASATAGSAGGSGGVGSSGDINIQGSVGYPAASPLGGAGGPSTMGGGGPGVAPGAGGNYGGGGGNAGSGAPGIVIVEVYN